jgi:hypothetical protein
VFHESLISIQKVRLIQFSEVYTNNFNKDKKLKKIFREKEIGDRYSFSKIIEKVYVNKIIDGLFHSIQRKIIKRELLKRKLIKISAFVNNHKEVNEAEKNSKFSERCR